MSLTRKDFIQLAKSTAVIIKETNKVDTRLKDVVLSEILGFCSGQNGLFNENRFKNAVEKFLK